MIPTLVPIYAAIFAVMLVGLSVRVARMRGDVRVGIGDGGNIVLRRAIRVQGNFTEYVPMALILFTFVEMQGWPRWLVHGFCLVLLAARAVHAYGIAREPEDTRFRATGMATTAVLLLAAAGLLLYSAIR